MSSRGATTSRGHNGSLSGRRVAHASATASTILRGPHAEDGTQTGMGSKKAKQSLVQSTYHTTGRSHGSSTTRAHTSHATGEQKFLPGVGPSPVYHGLPWQAPAAFPPTVHSNAKPPNLMAWVKGVSKLDTNHPEQRGYYVTGEMMQQGQEQYLTMDELRDKYSQQYARLAAQQQQQQFASTYPTPEQFQQFFLAQQAEQTAQERQREEAERQAALHARAQAALPADNPTLSLTWAPGSKGQPPNAVLGTTASQAQLLNKQGSERTIEHQPSTASLREASMLASSASQAHLQQQQQQAQQSRLASSSSQSGLLHGSASAAELVAGVNGEIVLKAKGLTQRRQLEQEAKEQERQALEAEERRLATEAKELREYQQEQQRRKQQEEKERLIVLKQSSRRSQASASTDYASQSTGNNLGFEFLVSPTKGPLHQTLRRGGGSDLPTPPPMPTFHQSMSQPTLYVHASTSQPLLPGMHHNNRSSIGSLGSLDNWNITSTASLPVASPTQRQIGAGAAVGGFSAQSPVATSRTVAQPLTQLSSYEDVRLNSSRISVDLDAPTAAAAGTGSGAGANKVVLNLSGKDLPADKNVVFTVWRKKDVKADQPQTQTQAVTNESNPVGSPSTAAVDDSLNWEYLGCTELIPSTGQPSFDRTFILDAPRGSNALHAAHLTPQGVLVESSGAQSGAGDMQLLNLTKKKHRLFAGMADQQPTIIKVSAVHVFHPEQRQLPPGVTNPLDTHLLPQPPSTASTLSTLPQAEPLGDAFFILEQVVDNPTQEFKLQPVPLTPTQILNMKRKQMELNRLGSNSQFAAHLQGSGSSRVQQQANNTFQPTPVQGVILVSCRTIGILVPIDLSLACSNLPTSEWMHKVDPVIVIYASNPNTGKFSWIGQTSRFRSTPSPIFPERLTVYSYSHCDRQLRFAVYDTELATNAQAGQGGLKYKERDLLGEIFVSLDELVNAADLAQQGSKARIEEIPSGSDDSSDLSTALTFRLLKRKQVVKVAQQDSVIHIKANMRPILLTNAPEEDSRPKGKGSLGFVPSPNDVFGQQGATGNEDDIQAPITIGGAQGGQNFLATAPAIQPMIPAKGSGGIYQPHMYDPEHPNETVYGTSAYMTQQKKDQEASVLVQLSISCSGLPKSMQTGKVDPIVTLYAAEKAPGNASSQGEAIMPTWRVISQTERFVNSGEPVFHRVLQAQLPLAPSIDGANGGDLRIAVHDSHETDHVRYHSDPSQPISGPQEYLVQESRLLGEHFFNLRLLAKYAQQQVEQQGVGALSPSIYLDLVKHGRIVLRRKGAPIKSEPNNLNANGAAQFQLHVLNLDQIPRLTEEEPNKQLW